MEKLILHNINKSYERGVPVLKDISLSVAKGDFVVLLGPSGSGKSCGSWIQGGGSDRHPSDQLWPRAAWRDHVAGRDP